MKKLVVFFVIVTSYCAVVAQSKDSLKSEDGLCFVKEVLAKNVCFIDEQIVIDSLPWNPHPTFKGVFLKHLILGKDTDNQISCHIVKIDPDCILDTHQHDGKIEIHEVIGGDGTIDLNNEKISYSIGQVCVIVANTPHKVIAGKNGLYLFAKFTPALQ